jgi:hypothetical protein
MAATTTRETRSLIGMDTLVILAFSRFGYNFVKSQFCGEILALLSSRLLFHSGLLLYVVID